MTAQTRITLSFILTPLLLAVLLVVYRISFEIGFEVLNSGLYNLSMFLLLHVVLVLPISLVLIAVYFSFSAYSLCYWWLIGLAAGTLFATVMWPLLGLNIYVPIIGLVGGVLFYMLALLPHTGTGPEIKDPLFLIRSLSYTCLFLALFFIPIKLFVVEVDINSGLYYGLAIKEQISLNSFISLDKPQDMHFILMSKETYAGQEYFKAISKAGWIAAPLLFFVTLILYLLTGRQLKPQN